MARSRDVAEGVAFLASAGARTFQGARLVMESGSTVQLYPDSCADDTSFDECHDYGGADESDCRGLL